MTIDSMQLQLRNAELEGEIITLHGYKTSSGDVRDIALYTRMGAFHWLQKRPGESDYKALIRIAQAWLNSDKAPTAETVCAICEATEEEYKQALQELFASWKVSTHKDAGSVGSLLYTAEGNYFVAGAEVGKTVEAERIVLLGRIAPDNSPAVLALSNSKNPVVRAKHYLRESSPMRLYIPRLNLEEGKVENITYTTR